MESEKLDERSEANAIEAARAGDPRAFEPLVRAHADRIRALCRSRCPNESEAEDALQEIFLRAYRSLAGFNSDGSFGAWLYGIAVNHLRSRYARLARRQEHEGAFEFEAPAHAPGPAEETERAETEDEVRAAIAELSESIRTVVELYYLKERSVKEIAGELNISVENVKSKLHRGRKHLRRILTRNATERPEKR